ncbi:phage portal protein [Paenibacillus paeoniae]|uniref:Phage portal protein n=1 Tax=Paenibacillus paeoniae TaxID=2292705 RepID=A0A371P068_9BACL|nr:phage portal protein [Paenibacillus paeoniae]REK69332.1 phage portal protein [Paenibacillus paeoniae]
MAIIRDRAFMPDPNEVSLELLASCVKEHQTGIARMEKLDEYYRGKHEILKRPESTTGLPNNKLVANHAKYITDIAVGYVLGNSVKYDGKQIEPVTDLYKTLDISSHDSEIGKDLSIYGIGRELYYFSSDEVPIPKLTCIDPRKLFLVVDDSVEYKSLFGVHYYPQTDIDGKADGFKVIVYTANNTIEYNTKSLTNAGDYVQVSVKPHYWDAVPVVEFWNNEEQMGDFEGVITLIDAYNTLASDRVNDKEQLVDAILKVKGMSLGDDKAEASKTIQLLKELKVLEMPSQDADAEWLIKQLNEQQVEVLRNAIKSDIHEFSMVPDLTDENFASNASGVAMKYKLFGLEQLAVTKERYFKQGLRERLAMFGRALHIKGQKVDTADAKITMTRNLPANDLEIAQLINLLIDRVSDETLISLLSFVEDPAEEIKKVRQQREEAMKLQQQAFGMSMGEQDDPDDEDVDDGASE